MRNWSWSDFVRGMWPELLYALVTGFVIGWLLEEIRKRDASTLRIIDDRISDGWRRFSDELGKEAAK